MPAAAPLAPPPSPNTSPAAFAGTIAIPRPPATGLGGTIVLPPTVSRPAARVEPPVTLLAEPAPEPQAEENLEPPKPVPIEATGPSEPDSTFEPPTLATAVAAKTTESFSPYGASSVLATSRGFPAQAPPVESLLHDDGGAEIHAEVLVPTGTPSEKPARRSSALLIVIALVALGVGVFGGLLYLQRSKAKPAPEAPTAAAPVTTPQAPADELPNVPPPPPSTATTASDEAQPSPAPTASAAPEAPTEAASAVAPAASVPPAPAAPPVAVPPPDFDLEKLPGDRAALLVRSSAQAHVFVHGRDYGETNRYLLTTCGIRFVRIGRGFNDFLEPGRSIVVKCGRLTEVTIEPNR
jgi:hypothetical protein